MYVDPQKPNICPVKKHFFLWVWIKNKQIVTFLLMKMFSKVNYCGSRNYPYSPPPPRKVIGNSNGRGVPKNQTFLKGHGH